MDQSKKIRKVWRRLSQQSYKGKRKDGKTNKLPYKRVYLYKSTGNKCAFLVHRLVLESFIGPCPEGMETRHLNGKHDDNRLSNLCWGTQKDNYKDKILHGTHQRGEKNPRTKLINKQVLEIRKLVDCGASTKDVSLEFDIPYYVVTDIKRRRSFRCLE